MTVQPMWYKLDLRGEARGRYRAVDPKKKKKSQCDESSLIEV
jgi:hypothetical protein